jgi:hypothetical protein
MLPMILSTPLDQVFDGFEQLSLDEQELAFDVMKRRYHERRREEMITQAHETSAAYRRGELKTKSSADFLREINAEHST